MKGLFITFEGPDGSGKTTQIRGIEKELIKRGYEVVVTREPGGTPISEKIRTIILDKENAEMDDITEALLYAASRAQHVAQVIEPAVQAGKIVLCDRFVDSSVVYQGIGRGLGIETVERINRFAIKDRVPDVTFLLKVAPHIGIERKTSQGSKDRLEEEKIEFHQRVYQGYQMLEKRYPHRIKGINADQSIDGVFEEIMAQLEGLLGQK